MEASRDIFMVPGARGHEYIRVSDKGIRTKLGIDATVSFADRPRFMRCSFEPVEIDMKQMTSDAAAVRKRLEY
jgi:2,5-furandicarboxylate decarboxylase 1